MRNMAWLTAALAGAALSATRLPARPAPATKRVTLLVHARLVPVTAPEIADGWLRVEDGKIAALGAGAPPAAPGAEVIDLTGMTVMPGLVDPHVHLGVYGYPSSSANADGNEATGPVTGEVRALDSFDPSDPAIFQAMAAGTTTAQVLPGSANAMGGQAAVIKLRPSLSGEAMLFAGARPAMKMAFGENPKRVYGSRGEIPSTRMGHLAVLRAAFQKAREYDAAWAAFRAGKRKEAPDRDLRSEAIAEMLRGERWAQVHCYTVRDFRNLFRLQDEFGFKIAAVHHALEAWKIPEEFVKRKIVVVTFSDLWGFKWEAYEGRADGAALLEKAGATVSLHTDHNVIEARDYRFEAARAWARGLSREGALKAVTLHPAMALGVADRVGSLEAGKDADLLVLDGDPLSMKSRARLVFLDGERVYDRARATERLRAERIFALPALAGDEVLP